MLTLEQALKLTVEAVEQMEWKIEPIISEISDTGLMGIHFHEDMWAYIDGSEWVVEMGVNYNNYPHEPNDYVANEVKRSKNFTGILTEFFDFYYNILRDNMREYIGFQEDELLREE